MHAHAYIDFTKRSQVQTGVVRLMDIPNSKPWSHANRMAQIASCSVILLLLKYKLDHVQAFGYATDAATGCLTKTYWFVKGAGRPETAIVRRQL